MVVATVLITLGCVGEYIYGSRAAYTAQQLQNASDAQLADTKLKAQSAVAAAAKLGVSFGNLDQFVKDKTKKIDAATDELKRETKNLSNAHDEALKAAQEAKKVLTKMETNLKALQDMQQQVNDLTIDRTICVPCVTEKIKSFGKIPFIFIVAEDHESGGLVFQIATALENAGWDWKPWDSSDHALHIGENITGKPFMLTQNSLRGISIQVASADLKILKKPAESLFSALKSEGLKNASWCEINDADMKSETKIYGVIHIFIGTK